MHHGPLYKRAKYIDKTSEIRNTFSWAHPSQIMKAADVYAGDHYGSNLWQLNSHTAEMYFKSWNTLTKLFKSWNTLTKLAWGVPRSTHTYLVENVLASSFLSARHQVLGRYVTFFQSLLTSPNREVRILARIVSQDKRSVTRLNIEYVTKLSGLSPWDFNKSRIVGALQKCEVKECDQWRLPFLTKLIEQRSYKLHIVEETLSIQTWIDSICST